MDKIVSGTWYAVVEPDSDVVALLSCCPEGRRSSALDRLRVVRSDIVDVSMEEFSHTAQSVMMYHTVTAPENSIPGCNARQHFSRMQFPFSDYCCSFQEVPVSSEPGDAYGQGSLYAFTIISSPKLDCPIMTTASYPSRVLTDITTQHVPRMPAQLLSQ